MNVPTIERGIEGNHADTEETLALLYDAMVNERGICYFEFPKLIEASKIRGELILQEERFQAFKDNLDNKKISEEKVKILQTDWENNLRMVARESGKLYSETGSWKDVRSFPDTMVIALANLRYPDEFFSNVGIPEEYNDAYMEFERIISKLKNDWNLRLKWPVEFSPDYIDTEQPCVIAGHMTKYFLPRQRFTRKRGGHAGLWVDKWMSEILGKEVMPTLKKLDVHAKWAQDYLAENPL